MASADNLQRQLELARRDLRELTTKNRLLDTPRRQERGVSLEIEDELCEVHGLRLENWRTDG